MNQAPKFILTRSGSTATIFLPDDPGGLKTVYRALQNDLNFEEHDTFEGDTFNDTGLDPEKRYKYKITSEDLENSIIIVEDETDEEPPGYIVEAAGTTTFTESVEEVDIPWGDNVDVKFILVGNIQQGRKSISKFTK